MDDALNSMARQIYERTYLRSWRQADFWVRAQILQTARALLEALEAREALGPDFAAEVRSLREGRQGTLPPCAGRCTAARPCHRLPDAGWMPPSRPPSMERSPMPFLHTPSPPLGSWEYPAE